jgi:DNA-nicking Smr family endonuclease
MAARARGLTEGDEAAWALFASRVAALPGRRAAVAPPELPPSETAPPSKRRTAEPIAPPSTRRAPLGVGGQPPGVDTATWQRFYRGNLNSVRKLDLHGMTAQHAFAALRAFLRAAHADRVRCVEIVTGRGNGEGTGVLRRELPLWLNLPEIRPMVLAAAHPHTSSAMHSHAANPGSVRLLLRRPRA